VTPDLVTLLAAPRPGSFDFWLDVSSAECADALQAVDIDGRRHGGLPFRFAGRTLVRMRHLPGDEAAFALACGLETARAWAVERMAGSTLVRMDYDVPWTLAVGLARRATTKPPTMSDLLTLSTREGNWLADFIGNYSGHPAVRSLVQADIEAAAASGIAAAPAITISGATIPAQPTGLHDEVERRLTT
jgi:hypothetical protein